MGPCFGATLFDDTMKNTTPKEGGLHLGAQLPWVLEEETFQVSLELERKQLQRSGRLNSLGWQTTVEQIWLHHRGVGASTAWVGRPQQNGYGCTTEVHFAALRNKGQEGISGHFCPSVQQTLT